MVRHYALIGAHLLYFTFFLYAAASAQNAPIVLPAGDAAVAGFSGTLVLGPPPPEPKRVDKTYIDLDGPSLRVVALGNMGGPPQAQLVPAVKSFTATARQIGQVFSLALDDASPPNLYAAASSAYGLPIVIPDADGDGIPDRSRRGASNAAFMPGLFGPVIADGGPGSIWKIDGTTGAVSLFANVTLNGVRNSGPALGGLAFDPASHQLFVADRDTGMIHRFTLDGVERGRFDHGVQGLSAVQLPPVAFDPRKRIDLQNPAFDSTEPATWGYAPTVRRVFGLGVYGSRLYYAVASGLRIWSVAILPDGSFGGDARIEVAIPPGPKPDAEISTIAFDGDGRMLLAERDPPTGAYDYKILATPAGGRALRLTAKRPGENGTPFYWQADGDYAVGFPPSFTNVNGGLALGYGYDNAGNIDRARCGASLWTTGEQLRLSPDRSLAERLRAGGALAVNGLQGNGLELLRPQNAPPVNSYFINYADPAEQSGLMGQIGGIAIWQICPRAGFSPEILTGILAMCPAGYVEIRNQCVPTSCRPDESYVNGKCEKECPVLRRAVRGECCPQGSTWDGQRCVPPRGPDLTIVKIKPPRCLPSACDYGILVTNLGPGTYSGDLIVGDITSLGQLSATNANGWICTNSVLPNGHNTETCRLPNATLAPNQSAPPLFVTLNSSNTTGTLVNCAIVDPRGDSNTSNNVSCTPPEKKTPSNPKLGLVKSKPDSCTFVGDNGQDPIWSCVFTITVTNDGTVPATDVTVTDVPPPGSGTIVGVQHDGSWSCALGNNSVTCRRPGEFDPGAPPISFDVTVQAPGLYTNTGNIRGGGEAFVNNCAAFGDVVGPQLPSSGSGAPIPAAPGAAFPGAGLAPVSGGPIQAAPGAIFPGRQEPQSCATIKLPKKDPPNTNPTCVPQRIAGCVCSGPPSPGGNICHSGECDVCGCPTAFVDGKCPTPLPHPLPTPTPPCVGSGCSPVTTTCAGGLPRNSDGNCPTTTTGCTGGKVVGDGGACQCPFGMSEDKSGKCVRSTTETKKPTRRIPRKPKTNPDSDNPGSSAPPVQFQFQIGPGLPSGGGHPGGGKPPGGNVPNRTKG